MISVAIYVQQEYAKKAYKTESYNVRAWPGLEMVRDALEQSGHMVAYCAQDSVTSYDVILVSITSAFDWYTFVAERIHWPKGSYRVIVGGAGVDNIRPFLEYADVFVFGRAEDLICPVVEALGSGDRFEHPSVCYADSFSPDRSYKVNQAADVYKHAVTLANGKEWKERDIGCPRRCLYCGYTWSRKFLANQQWGDWGESIISSGFDERTIFDYDLDNPESWGAGHSWLTVGMDGMSERLRFMVLKPIRDDMLYKLFVGLPRVPKLFRLKLFNIVGYPTETDQDRRSVVDLFIRADQDIPPIYERLFRVTLCSTPFKAMPVTPAACWPMSYQNYRGFHKVLRAEYNEHEWQIHEGKTLTLSANYGTEGLATVALWALAVRGVEADAGIIRKLVMADKFWRANSRVQQVTLEKYLDVDRLFSAYTWDTLPTRYLSSYTPPETLAQISAHRLRKYGGAEGERLADFIGLPGRLASTTPERQNTAGL